MDSLEAIKLRRTDTTLDLSSKSREAMTIEGPGGLLSTSRMLDFAFAFALLPLLRFGGGSSSHCSATLQLVFAAAVAVASPQHQRSRFGKRFLVVILLESNNIVFRIIINYKQKQTEVCHH